MLAYDKCCGTHLNITIKHKKLTDIAIRILNDKMSMPALTCLAFKCSLLPLREEDECNFSPKYSHNAKQ